MNKVIRYSIPYIPIIGIIVMCLSIKLGSWVITDKYGNYDNPLSNILVNLTSAIVQVISIFQLLSLC